jgi:hypothetical protein
VERELRQNAREENSHLWIAEVVDEALSERESGPNPNAATGHDVRGGAMTGAKRREQGLHSQPDQINGARKLEGVENRFGSQQDRYDADVGGQRPRHLPRGDPSAVKTPAERPPSSAFLMVSAVSGPASR